MDSRQSSGQPIQAGHVGASPNGTQGRPTTAVMRAADLDLLRLSYICRTDVLLRGQPERSLALAKIHRFFDRVPPGAALDELLLSALIDRGTDPAAPTCVPALRRPS